MGSICEVARAVALRIMAVLVAAWLPACGGGGGGVGTGGTGTDGGNSTATNPDEATVAASVVGPITGLGSIIVNGVRFETGSDIRSADEGVPTNEADLRLGMMVEIRGSINADRSSGRASQVRWFSELRGTVASVDSAARSFVVLGVPVGVSSSTVYSGVDALDSLRPGDVVEVYGLRDPTTNRLAATRIELARAPASAAPLEYKLRATVSNLDAASRRFSLGAVLVTYAADTRIDPAPNGVELGNGQMVTVYSNQPPNSGPWPAARIQVRSLAGRFEGVSYGQVEGLITGFASPSNFTVAGVGVDASGASFTRGNPTDLRNGARVEVDGRVESGRIVAARIKVERSDEDDDTERSVRGPVTAFQSISHFTVRGVTVDASQPGVRFEGGNAADLMAGRTVRVEGRVRNTVLVASTVRFEANAAQSISQTGQSADQSADTLATVQAGEQRSDSASGPGQNNGQNPAGHTGAGSSQDIELRGVVTRLSGPGSFVVGGYTIDASRPSVRFDGGTAASLRDGGRVEVDGRLAGGIVVASRVRIQD